MLKGFRKEATHKGTLTSKTYLLAPAYEYPYLMSVSLFFRIVGGHQNILAQSLVSTTYKFGTHMSLLMGSGAAAVVVFFLSKFRCDLPLRSRLKDSRSDFFKDFRRDMGLSSELAMSEREGI